jgi:hypothetical protein
VFSVTSKPKFYYHKVLILLNFSGLHLPCALLVDDHRNYEVIAHH